MNDELRTLADDVARMPIGCDCIDCYNLRRELAERAEKLLSAPPSEGK